MNWPGLGTLLIQAINTRDYPVVQGCVLLIALGYVLANFLTDALYALSDLREVQLTATDLQVTGQIHLGQDASIF